MRVGKNGLTFRNSEAFITTPVDTSGPAGALLASHSCYPPEEHEFALAAPPPSEDRLIKW